MNFGLFIKGISAAAATIICSYVGTQYFGKNIMYAIGGGIVGTGITTFFTDRIADQIEANRIVLRQPQSLTRPTSCRGCKYYHGIEYNGVPFNCAIHPEGYEGNQCPDWQTFNYLNK